MKEYPFPGYEYPFNKPVIFMFSLVRSNAIGVYYGLEDQEKIAEVTLKEQTLDKHVYKLDGFDGYMTSVYPQVQPDQIVVAAKMALRVLNLDRDKQNLDYMPDMPNDKIKFEYKSGKIVNAENQIVLSLFDPFISPENKAIHCLSLVVENLKDGIVIKRLRVNEESEETIFLGREHSYFLECGGDINQIQYRWRVVDNNLDFIDHPLIPILNEQRNIYHTDAILISESQECAIARGSLEADLTGKSFFQITPWINERPAIPIVLPDSLHPSKYISQKTFLLSPSGKWLFFAAARDSAPGQGPERYFLMYIDKTLPSYYLPPIEIETGGEEFQTTWMQGPEGFVVWNGKHLRYWDLSKFDPAKIK